MEHREGGPQEPARGSPRRREAAWGGARGGAGKGKAPSLLPGPGAPALVLEGTELGACVGSFCTSGREYMECPLN